MSENQQKRNFFNSEFDELFAKSKSLIEPGLEQVRRVANELNLLDRLPPCITVGGTNGKGSTTGMLWHLLSTIDYPCGLFTSPHLVHFSERIQCNHANIQDEDILGELKSIKNLVNAADFSALSFFEVTLIIALSLFIKKDCKLIILEVGLGGRWDATNIIDSIASVIVSIDKDHEQWLGSELKQIAREKLGIARKKRPLFWGEKYTEVKPRLRETLESHKLNLGFQLMEQGLHFSINTDAWVDIHLPELPNLRVKAPVWVENSAPIIRDNFAISFSVFYWFISQLETGQEQLDKLISLAISNFSKEHIPWPPSLIGRNQSLYVVNAAEHTQQEIILDVCHNPASAKEFAKFLTRLAKSRGATKQFPAIMTILSDKDIKNILECFKEILSPIIFFKIHHDRSTNQDIIHKIDQDLRVFENFDKACKYAYSSWRGRGTPWVICGSVIGIGEVLDYFSAFSTNKLSGKSLNGHFPFAQRSTSSSVAPQGTDQYKG